MVQVHAHERARTLGQGDHGGADLVERRHGLMALGVAQDDGVAGLLGGVEGRTHRLEARRVERAHRHVVLFGDVADVAQVDEHFGLLVRTVFDGSPLTTCIN